MKPQNSSTVNVAFKSIISRSVLCCYLAIFGNMPIAQVSFTVDVSSGCAPLTVNATNTTHFSMDTTKATFYWYFEGPGDFIIDDSTYDASFT